MNQIVYFRIRKLPDKTYRLTYYWSFWDTPIRRVFDTQKEAIDYIGKIISRTFPE